MFSDPLAYFLTFHTYGTWLPGHKEGSVDDEHNRYCDPLVPADETKQDFAQRRQIAAAIRFSIRQRQIILQAIVGVAEFRSWRLHAVHVRETHVHVVVTSALDPERTMNDFKTWSTRRLREAKEMNIDQIVWSRHGSTPYLWKDEQVAGAVHYTLFEQGEVTPGTVYPDPSEPRT